MSEMNVNSSKEIERQYIIQRLNLMEIYKNQQGEPLENLDYYSVWNLWSEERAARI